MDTVGVILNYNDFETTEKLLNKIKDYTALKHIVVVDNKSTDDSYEKLKKYSSEKIHIILADKNGGYGYGNNLGIKYAYDKLKAKAILIANPDTYFENECIEAMQNTLANQINCAVVSVVEKNNTQYNAWKNISAFKDVLSTSIIFNRLLGVRYYKKEYFEGKEWVYVDVVGGPMLMVRADIMIQYGMYDEEFFLYEEEKVLAYKMKEHNFKTILLLTHSYEHNHSVSINKTYKSEVHKKRILLKSKKMYLSKYLKINKFEKFMCNIFFGYTLIEMFVYMKFKK